MGVGGILKYAIVIEATDRASGRLNEIKNNLRSFQQQMKAPMFSTGVGSGLYDQNRSLGNALAQKQRQVITNPYQNAMAEIYRAQRNDAIRLQKSNADQIQADLNWNDPSQYKGGSAYLDAIKNRQIAMQKRAQQKDGHLIYTTKDAETVKKLQDMYDAVKKIDEKFKGAGKSAKEFYSEISKHDSQKLLAQAQQVQFGTVHDLSETDVARLKHMGVIQDHDNRLEALNNAYSDGQRALGEYKSQLLGLSTIYSVVNQAMNSSLQMTRQLTVAQILGGQAVKNAYSNSAYGGNVAEYGALNIGIARSSDPEGMSALNKDLMAMQKLLGQDAAALVPVVGGLSDLYGISKQNALEQMFIAGSKSATNFTNMFSLFQQNAIPELQEMKGSLSETLALIGVLENRGAGHFVARGLGTAIRAITNPAKPSMDLQAQMGIDMNAIIKQKGLLSGLLEIGKLVKAYSPDNFGQNVATMFPGQGSGVMMSVLESVPAMIKMQAQIGGLTEQSRILFETNHDGYFRWQQNIAAVTNAQAGFFTMFKKSRVASAMSGAWGDALNSVNALFDKQNEGKGKGLIDAASMTAIGVLTWKAVGLASQFKNVWVNLQGINAEMMKMGSANVVRAMTGQALLPEGSDPIAHTRGAMIGKMAGNLMTIAGYAGLTYMLLSSIGKYIQDRRDESIKKAWDPVTQAWDELASSKTDEDRSRIVKNIEDISEKLDKTNVGIFGIYGQSTKQNQIFMPTAVNTSNWLGLIG